MMRVAFFVLALSSTASAQQLLHRFDGIGYGAGPVGDIDQDGCMDFVSGGGHPVRSEFYSGRTHRLIWFWAGAVTTSLCLGDVDADGVDDFALFDFDWWNETERWVGRIDVFSGARQGPMTETRRRLWFRQGERERQHFGWTRANIGDVNQDGADDLIVGDVDRSQFLVYSGRNGALIHQKDVTNYFGACAIGDANGDSYPDFAAVIGGDVKLFSGATFSVLGKWKFGSVPGLSSLDVDRDGVAEVVISYAGDTSIYSCIDGSLLYKFNGLRGGNIGDLDGDGWDDLAARPSDGRINFYSGRTFRLLDELLDNGEHWALNALPLHGDTNGDGFDDFVSAYSGKLWLWGGDDLFLRARPEEHHKGEFLRIWTEAGEPGAPAMLVTTSLNGSPAFIPIAIGNLDSEGAWFVAGDVPPGLAGSVAEFTAYAWAGIRGLEVSSPETVAFR